MIDINKLIDKDPVQVDKDQISSFIKGKRVLITGAAGSIGSELVRQICTYQPSEIIFYDRNEERVFYLEKEIKTNYPNINIITRLGSITDSKRADLIFEECKPQIIFHTAANKHVPLSEENPQEAFMNNVGGTINLVRTAIKYKCESFVFISTDKAVDPTSVMGHTKRLCELYIQSIQDKYQTNFTTVRFGNVLGSSGSVVEIFQKQLQTGTLTITHPEMTRYFLTIPDACSLLIQAAAFKQPGLFILEMGEPVFIIDLAKRMIEQSGLNVGMKITEVRPGEKIKEELSTSLENLISTSHPKINMVQNVPNLTQAFMDIVLLENECNYITKEELKLRLKSI